MLGVPLGALGLAFGFECCALFGADGLAMAAFLRLDSSGLGDGGAGDAEGGQGEQDVFANRGHFRSLLVCESVVLCINMSLHRSHDRQKM
jgi:hypothetical protein